MAPRRGNVSAPAHFRRPWLRSERPVPRLVVRPLERFLEQEAGSASLLLGAALVALVWANVHLDSYDGVWETKLSLEVGGWRLEEDLRHLVNELLMALFFFVVALEVKREIRFGTLNDRRTAIVPVAAALGTMAGAAAVYAVVNLGGGGDLRGWAIPIATDIAFALGALGLAGRRAPRELRAFLLTLAVVDDVGAIVVIAVFFTDDLSPAWLGVAAAAVAGILVARRLGVRAIPAYVGLGAALWVAVFESGVHATMAGVVLGFLTPALAFHSRQETGEVIGEQLTEIAESDEEISQGTMIETARLATEAVSPLARLELALHPWSAYVVLPVFALANAGVPVSLGGLGDALTGRMGLGIVLGLVVGKAAGGLLLAWLVLRSGRSRMPEGLDWPALAGVAPLLGIGFTIAIFMTTLTFQDREVETEATLAVLVASVLAAALGLAVLNLRHRALRRRGAATR